MEGWRGQLAGSEHGEMEGIAAVKFPVNTVVESAVPNTNTYTTWQWLGDIQSL